MQELGKYVVLPENITIDDYVAIDVKLETEEEFSKYNLIYNLLSPQESSLF